MFGKKEKKKLTRDPPLCRLVATSQLRSISPTHLKIKLHEREREREREKVKKKEEEEEEEYIVTNDRSGLVNGPEMISFSRPSYYVKT